MKKILGIVAGVAILVIVIGVALHASSSKPMQMGMQMGSSGSSSQTKAVDADHVTISDYMFSPMTIRVKVGTKVTWTNQDSVHHSVTADTASKNAPNGPLFGKGESYSFTFNKAGTYSYHCMPHPYMHGTVIVTN